MSELRSLMFARVVRLLAERNIPYCILRNYEDYPARIAGDVDMLVLPEDAGAADAAVRDAADAAGAQVWDQCGRRDAHGMHRMIFWPEQDGADFGTLELDLAFRLEERGVVYADARDAIARRRPEGGFFVLDEDTELLHIVARQITAPDEASRKRYAEKAARYAAEGRTPPPAAVVEKLRSGRHGHSMLSRVLRRIRWTLRPPGEFVVLLGPDGVGKSTAAERADKLLRRVHVPSRHLHLGFRPSVLPKRSDLGLGAPRARKEGGAMEVLRFFYHLLDYVLGYWTRIYPLRTRGVHVIAERYFYDYILHSARKDTPVPASLARTAFRLLVPKPTACVLLVNDPDEVLRRRQELSREEIVRVLEEGERLGRTAQRFVKIETNVSPEEVAARLARWIACPGAKSGTYGAFYERTYPRTCGDPEADPFFREIADFISAFDLRGKKVLEIGSGTGKFQDAVEHYVGLDVAENLRRFYHKPFFVVGDDGRYPFPDSAFDAAFTNAVFEHIPDIENALRETVRVLKPGGVMLFNVAWQVRPWASGGYAVRPYGELSFFEKVIKASIPLREHVLFRALSIMPARAWRTAKYVVRPRAAAKLDHRKLDANYEVFYDSDSDACNHIDPHAAIIWFLGHECAVLNYPTLARAFMVRTGSLIVKKLPADGHERP